jgi:hypothetical protein
VGDDGGRRPSPSRAQGFPQLTTGGTGRTSGSLVFGAKPHHRPRHFFVSRYVASCFLGCLSSYAHGLRLRSLLNIRSRCSCISVRLMSLKPPRTCTRKVRCVTFTHVARLHPHFDHAALRLSVQSPRLSNGTQMSVSPHFLRNFIAYPSDFLRHPIPPPPSSSVLLPCHCPFLIALVALALPVATLISHRLSPSTPPDFPRYSTRYKFARP